MNRLIKTIVFLCIVTSYGASQNFEAQLVIDNDNNILDVQMRTAITGTEIPMGTTISTISLKLIGASNITSLISSNYTLQVPDINGIISTTSAGNPSPDTWSPGVWIEVASYNLNPALSPYSLVDLVITSQAMAANSTEIPTMSASIVGGFNQIVEPQATILPITLSTFTAVSNQRNTDLRWTTSSETNASHFGVQRSRDGYNWENVVKVTAVGESNTLQEYDYVDINAIDEVNDEGHLYYRLVLTDLDGSYEYSDMQKVKFDTSSTTIFSVYPNPTIQRVSLDMKGYIIDQNTSVSLFDASGRLVLQNAIENTNYEIDLKSAGLSAGVYTIMLMQGNKVVAQRLIALL